MYSLSYFTKLLLEALDLAALDWRVEEREMKSLRAGLRPKTGWVCQACNCKLRLLSTGPPSAVKFKGGKPDTAETILDIEQKRLPSKSFAQDRNDRERADPEHAKWMRALSLDEPARTRFAPSPTGKLHLGSIRTALYNYLLAKHTGGQFLLRIEDTDQKRTIEGAESQLIQDLRRYGLDWDEGPDPLNDSQSKGPYGPYRQSLRNDIYRQHAKEIIRTGHAYRCFCSAERLDQLARQRNDMGLPLGYDRKCLNLPADEADAKAATDPFVVRLKVPDQYPPFFDMVHCKIGRMLRPKTKLQGQDVFDDPILLKTDGHATYHFANVVDDHLMKITHVIRGSEWLSSTPLHTALYKAFEWMPPIFCHVPLIVDTEGQKLSKRDEASDLATYEGPGGVYPEVLLNFVALLGWSHTENNDYMTLKKMEELFLPKFTKGNVTLTFEKLHYLQNLHTQRIIKESSAYPQEFQSLLDDVQHQVHKQFSKLEVSESALPHLISSLLRADTKRWLKRKALNTSAAEDFVTRNAFFFIPTPSDLPFRKPLKLIHPKSDIHTAVMALCLTPESAWNTDAIHAAINALIPPSDVPDSSAPGSATAQSKEILELKSKLKSFRNASGSSIARFEEMIELELNRVRELRSSGIASDSLTEEMLKLELRRSRGFRQEIHQWLRWALLAGSNGPNIATTMELLGRERSLQRIKTAIASSKSREASKDSLSKIRSEVRLRMGRDKVE
ncbi:MAG: hypothetical protein Q9160_001652 [Pyrenula sp. 1 TL-2023]